MSTSKNVPEVDEHLYSRQLYVFGRDAMKRMAGAAVLISGMKGLGVEIAKNVTLAGVKSVTVHDQSNAQWSDLSSQFYLSEKNVGQNRALISKEHLNELNPYVPVEAYTGDLCSNILSAFQVVVLIDSPLEEQLRVSDFCHANDICFIVADTKGLTGQLFCDFGENFTVYDPSEAEPASATIHHITQGNPGTLTVAYDSEQRPVQYFQNRDWVVITQVEGMTELNDSEPRLVNMKDDNTLEIGDTSSFSPYERGGIVTQVKMPENHSFKPLRVSMTNPKIKCEDEEKLPRYCTLHKAFQALHVFWHEMQRLPRPRDQADADKMVKLAQTSSLEEENLVRTFAYGCAGDLSPMNSFIGGLAAQEVLKAASGKFTPLDQWLYFDAYECLPEEELTQEDCAPRDSRYDGQIAVFGADFQERLGKQKYFVVGSGAIGCELLKNFAMIGLGAGEGGNITVTDMDNIAVSNLNRQFLFRQQDVSKPKSEVAATAITCMNPRINVTAAKIHVGPETEGFFGDDFFLSLDGVATALDNIEARQHVSERCVQYHKPLLDSGTEGTLGHVEVFLPSVTAAYDGLAHYAEETIPLCTLRNFPNSIQHTVQWAQDQFEGLFKMRAEDVNKFLKDPSLLKAQRRKDAKFLKSVQVSLQEKPQNWADCVVWARRLWERLFSYDIQQLLYCYPPESVEKETRLPFWSGPKRCPQPVNFDCNNATHTTFIWATSLLLAETYRLSTCPDKDTICQLLQSLQLPSFHPQKGVHIPLLDQEIENPPQVVDEMSLEELRNELAELRRNLEEQGLLLSGLMEPIHFDKDNDCHLDFITMASNLRAENYGIPCADKLQTKKIVGKIIPAIATTTAAVAGLVCLELYKLVWQHRSPSSYCRSFLRLSEPALIRCQLQSLPSCEKTWNCLDKIEVPGIDAEGKEITLRGLLEHIQREHRLLPEVLLYGYAVLYDGADKEEKEQRLSSRLTELVHCVTGEPVSKKVLVLSMGCKGDDHNSVSPSVHVLLQ